MVRPGLESKRVARVSSALATTTGEPVRSLCLACAEVVGVMGAAVVLVSRGRVFCTACVSDPVSAAAVELEDVLGEGPCTEAHAIGAPVLVPDLARPAVLRWSEYCRAALTVGAGAAFGYPLLVETVGLGALGLYHDRPGPLTAEQSADAVAAAHVSARMVLNWQADSPAEALAWQLEPIPEHRASFHQATGMVSVQANVSVADAQLMLRARAFAEDRRINDLARDVVAGHLRFD